MNQKYIFIDIDGTLFDHSTNSIPTSSIKALQKAKINGHEVFICTGRPLPDIESEIYELSICGMILSCGAHIMIGNKTIYRAQFPQHELRYLVNFMLEHQIGFSLEGVKRNYLNQEAYTFFQSYVLKVGNENSELAKALLKQRNMYHFSQISDHDYEQIVKISIFSKNLKACKQLMSKLPKNMHGYLNENKEQELITGEISIQGINKATGIDRVLKHFKHDLKNTVALGDSLNDLEMIEHVAIGICMGNGSQALKKRADYITDSIEHHGFAKALKHFNII